MGRIVAIDYGRKRTGVAVTDTLQLIANGLATVPSGELVKFLTDYVAREPVERVVVGLPKQMNNELSENMKYVKAFVAQLKRALPDVPVEYYLRLGAQGDAGGRSEKKEKAGKGVGRRNQCGHHPPILLRT